MSASSNTTTGALPPSSRCTRLRLCDAAAATSWPARTEPVTLTIDGDVVHDHRPTGVAVTADDVEDAGREELGGDLGEQRGAGRCRVAGLQHDCVAGGERRTELPHGHHHRVVPRRDLCAHTDGLAADERRHVAHVLGAALALEMSCRGREEPDLVDHRRDLFAAGQVDRLAAVLDLERDQFLGTGLDGIGESEQRQRTLARRAVAPRVERRRRGLHCVVDVGLARERGGRVLLAGGRIRHGGRPPIDRVDLLTVDEVLERLHACIPLPLCRGWCARLVANSGRS